MNSQDSQYRIGLAVIVAVFCLVPSLGTVFPEKFGLLEAYKPWQESMSAVLGLVAAAFAASYVVMEIRHAQSLEDGRRARSRKAWRATMPEAMSWICDYATRSYDALVDQHVFATRPGGLVTATNPIAEPPELKPGVLADIRAMIEVSEPYETDHFVQVLSELQVHRARWSGRQRRLQRGQNVPAVELETEMLEAAELYARASNLIGATRAGEPEDEPTSRGRALRLLTPTLQPIPQVGDAAERADKRDPLGIPTAPVVPRTGIVAFLRRRLDALDAHFRRPRIKARAKPTGGDVAPSPGSASPASTETAS